MSATHANKITVNVYLDPSPITRASFSSVLLLAPLATNPLGGDRVVAFGSPNEAQDAADASEIDATTLAAIDVAFSQNNRPDQVKVGYVDVVGGEGWDDGLAACEQADPAFYGIVPLSRTTADQLEVSAAVEAANYRIVLAQNADADWLTSGIPAAWSDAAERERTAVVYHDTASAHADVAWACDRLAFDADEASVPWECQLKEVAAYATGLSTTQRNFAEANHCNLVLPFSTANQYLDPGCNLNGRRLYEIVTADWLKTRIEEDVAYVKLQWTTRGQKIGVNAVGQAVIQSVVEKWLQVGEAVGHLEPGQTVCIPKTITQDDRDQGRLRFDVRGTIQGDASSFTFNVYLSRSLVFDEAA